MYTEIVCSGIRPKESSIAGKLMCPINEARNKRGVEESALQLDELYFLQDNTLFFYYQIQYLKLASSGETKCTASS